MSPAGEVISPGLRPPLQVALAKPFRGLPPAGALPGQMVFEPKFDGYRVLIFREEEGRTRLWSRQGKDLTRYSVGVKRRRADLWPGESGVVSARQVSLTCLSMSTSFRATRTASWSVFVLNVRSLR